MIKKVLPIIIILFILIISFIVVAVFGFFQRSPQSDLDDICYDTHLEILDCFYSIDTKTAQVDLKLNGGRLDSVQGLISGKILGRLAGAEDVIALGWDTPYQKIIEFNFDTSVDGIALDNFEGPFKLQIRPILEGKQCIQVDIRGCQSN